MKPIAIQEPDRVRRDGPRGRRGFTFIELIVGLAIVVLLAAVVTPSVTASIDRTRTQQGAEMLAALAASATAFFNDTNDNPSRLSHLTNPISTAQSNSCGSSYDNGDLNQWAGPYYRDRVIVADGVLPVFIGNAQDQLVRVSISGNAGLLGIMVTGVREEDVVALDDRIDAGNGSAVGTIRWAGPHSEGLYTMGYYTPISGC